jgi:hypothetical protein
VTHIPPTPRSRRRGWREALAVSAALVLAASLIAISPSPTPARAAEVFSDGFETGDLSKWTAFHGMTVQTQQVLAGTYAARSSGSVSWMSRTLPDPSAEVAIAFQARFVARSSAVILARVTPSSGPWFIQLLVNKGGKLAYRNNVTDVTRVSGAVLSTGRWYALEMRLMIAGASSTVEVLLDGAVVPELTQTENLGSSPAVSFELGNRPSGRSYDLAVDEVVVGSEAGGGGGGCPVEWATVPAPSTVHALTGVSGIAEDDAWAVGFLKGTQAVPTAARWNGSSWRTVAVDDVGDDRSAFNAVDASSASHAWAVGYIWSGGGESGAVYRTMTQRWDGTRWTLVPSPNQGAGSNDLVDVDVRSTTDAWAVGYRMDGDVKKTLAMRWNGTAWSVVATPSPGSASSGLTAVVAVSADEAWAVGYRGDGVGYEPLILRWNGLDWVVRDASALDLGRETILTGVAAVGSGNVWTVGYGNGSSGYLPVTGHLVTGTWASVPADDPGDPVAVVQDVAVGSGGIPWAAGFRHGNRAGSETTLIQRHADGAWGTVASPNASPSDNALYGITDVPGTTRLWAVGRSEQDALILTACPGTTTSVVAPAPEPTSSLGEPASGSVTSAADEAPASLATAIDVKALDVAGTAGLRFEAHTFPPTVFDHDGDGWDDVMLNRHYEAGSTLFINNRDGTYSPVFTFPRLDRHGCDAGDVSGDGRPDLYCTTGANYGTDAKANELWIQTAGGWEDRAAASHVLDPFGRGRDAQLVDADRDGDLDLYVGNIRERGDGLPSPNRFLLNSGGTFVPAQGFGLDVELRVGCVDAADLDGDAYRDLLVCTNAGPTLYRNDGGTGFEDVTETLAPALKGSDGAVADVNGDGRPDLVMVQAGYVRIWIQTSTGTFVKRAELAQSGAQKVAVGDVDLDGLPDIYVLRGATSGSTNASDVMLLNDGDGLTYSSMTMPGSPGGSADSVEPIDHDHNGQTDFLVMNGDGLHNTPGFTQLIAFFPA